MFQPTAFPTSLFEELLRLLSESNQSAASSDETGESEASSGPGGEAMRIASDVMQAPTTSSGGSVQSRTDSLDSAFSSNRDKLMPHKVFQSS